MDQVKKGIVKKGLVYHYDGLNNTANIYGDKFSGFDFSIGDKVKHIYSMKTGKITDRWFDDDELIHYYRVLLDDGEIIESKQYNLEKLYD
jgi:hypothetical protein